MKTKIDQKTKKLNKEIARRNKQFKNATNAQKRVLVAKDVLKQIKLRRIIPHYQIWADLDTFLYDDKLYDSFNSGVGIRELFLTDQINDCDCCALGSLAVSCTLYNNNVTCKNVNKNFNDISWVIRKNRIFDNGLNKIFSNNQLKLIESYFENGKGAFTVKNSISIDNFNKKYPEPEEKLTAIMKNIIKNKGTFIP